MQSSSRRIFRLAAPLMAAMLLVSGCLVQSKIQGRYIDDQGDCRDSAEDRIGSVEKPNDTAKDRNTKLVTLFADCMAKKGWQVARPKSKPTTDGPHGPLDPYPSAVTSTTTTTTTSGPVQQPGQHYQQPATQGPVGQQPVQTTTPLLSPSGGMPPLSQPTDSGPAYYQPGRGSYTPPNPYGTGAGRNF